MTAIVVPSAATRSLATGRYDRVFYSSLAIVMALVVFVGFAPTYYLRPFITPPVTVAGRTTISPLAHLHGALFTAWVVLFVIQPALIASRRLRLHQRLGIAGAVLAAALVLVGTVTALRAAATGGAPPGVDPFAFLVVPLFDMVLFAIFITTAIAQRRNKEAHKRLMVLAYVSIIPAAVARWPRLLQYGPLMFFGLSFVFVLAGALYDFASRRRVHPAYLWGGLLILVSTPLRLMISTTAAWNQIAHFLARS
jgi:hypothetical protein